MTELVVTASLIAILALGGLVSVGLIAMAFNDLEDFY